MGTDNGDATIGEEKRTQRQLGKKTGTQRRGGQKSEGTGRLAAITETKLGILSQHRKDTLLQCTTLLLNKTLQCQLLSITPAT